MLVRCWDSALVSTGSGTISSRGHVRALGLRLKGGVCVDVRDEPEMNPRADGYKVVKMIREKGKAEKSMETVC